MRPLPRLDAGETRFARLAEKTGAQAYVMPAPFFANTVEDREVLLAQRGVREVFDTAARAEPKIVEIGKVEPGAQLVASGMIEREEIAEIVAQRGMGELLGQFFDARGRLLEMSLTARTLAEALEAPGSAGVVAVAGGADKVEAVLAVLTSRRLEGLITGRADGVGAAGLTAPAADPAGRARITYPNTTKKYQAFGECVVAGDGRGRYSLTTRPGAPPVQRRSSEPMPGAREENIGEA